MVAVLSTLLPKISLQLQNLDLVALNEGAALRTSSSMVRFECRDRKFYALVESISTKSLPFKSPSMGNLGTRFTITYWNPLEYGPIHSQMSVVTALCVLLSTPSLCFNQFST